VVVDVDGEVGVVGGTVVSLVVDVVGGTVVVVVVVVGATVVVVVVDVDAVVGGTVVVVVVVVGATVVVVVVDVDAVVGGTVVVVVVVVGATVVVVDVDSVVGGDVGVPPVVVVVPGTTGIVTKTVFGMAQTAAASVAPFNVTVVVNVYALSVMFPDAGAVAFTVTVGVVNVPGGNGPGLPDVILSVPTSCERCDVVIVAPPAVGTTVAVPGSTTDPATNVAPLIW
jgi:hypothetical protein